MFVMISLTSASMMTHDPHTQPAAYVNTTDAAQVKSEPTGCYANTSL